MFPIDAFRATLCKAAGILQHHRIRFHLTGGMTSMAYGEPRMTQDVDLVVDNAAIAVTLEQFLESLRVSDFLFDEESVRVAVERRGLFQLLDCTESLKLDMYARELIPGELDRSQVAEILDGLTLPIASLRDAALSKLIWVSKGSHKNRQDFRRIFNRANEIDRAAVLDGADELGLSVLANEILNEPDEIL